MLILLEFTFWLSVLALMHSYLFYPMLLKGLASGKKSNQQHFDEKDNWPRVSVIMAVHNEEAILAEKLDSLLNQDYPFGQYHIYVGSDCSTDRTDEILSAYAAQSPQLHYITFQSRKGKPGIVNALVKIISESHPPAADHIYLLTDASVILTAETVMILVRHFANPEIFLVDTHIRNQGLSGSGIALSESQYVRSEVKLKYYEGLLWGKMIGPFGGCYALRSDYYFEVPDTYLVDDFYITMKGFQKGGNAISDLEAICYESVPDDIGEEYRRKARISAGNFQNLITFRAALWRPFEALGFAFWSHKVFRWLGPFFIIFTLISSAILGSKGNLLYQLLFYLQLVILVAVPIFDWLLKKVNVHIQTFRNITYFIAMNVALLEGFFKYLKGVKNNVWQPPKRQ